MRLILGAAGEIHPYHLKWVDETWTKVDKYVDDGKTVMMDATQLEYPDDSIEAIYASHLLEHFSYLEVPRILKHWFDKLQSGGWLHINVPDLSWTAHEIIRDTKTSEVFNTEEAVINGIIYGSQAHEGEYHKSGYTKNLLINKLLDAGFVDIDVQEEFDAHAMGVLIADCYKP